MMECLLMKKHIRNFLYVYTQESWSDVIPLVFEIAVLNLQNSFAKSGFTKQELMTIITDLRNNEYYPRESKYHTIQKLGKMKGKDNTDISQSNGKEEHKATAMIKSHRNTNLQSIYPLWWANNNNNESDKHHRHKKHQHKKRHSKKPEEIPKKPEEILQKNNDFCEISKEDEQTEVKHQQKTEKSKDNTQTEVEKQQTQIITTNESIEKSKGKKMAPLKSSQEKTRMNYKISYDKNLNPSSMEKKTKEPMYCYSYNENGGLQRNPSAENIHSSTVPLLQNNHQDIEIERFKENITNPHIVKGDNNDEGELSEFEVSDTTKHLFKTKIQQKNNEINNQSQSQYQHQYDQRQSSIQDDRNDQQYQSQTNSKYTYQYEDQQPYQNNYN